MDEDRSRNQKPTLFQMMFSVLASMFGVQSQRNRERDFTHGSPAVFIGVALLFMTLFVVIVWGVVSLVLSFAGT